MARGSSGEAPFSFFWHDYETFGRDPRRQRPAQFAGVRTDAELNEISEPVNVLCHPPQDVLPEPEAALLTGITPQHNAEHGLTEQRFAQVVHGQLAMPGTVGVGYNSIRFDDEFTRFLFWRNLIDPYGREWQNGCGRWDLIDTVRCAWALRPEGISWPQREDGQPSFKLEHLSTANGLAHDSAHDALSDVRATIALARLIRQRQPKLWDFCLKLRDKRAVIDEIGIGRPFVHLSGRYALAQGSMAIVWPLAPHPVNRNELIVWDLAHSPQELFTLNAQAIRQRLFTASAELPAGVTRLPIKTIHLNRSPIVIAELKTLGPAVRQRFAIDVDEALRHAELAQARSHLMHGIWPEVFARPQAPSEVDVDEDLYGGFLSNGDRALLERALRTPVAELAQREPAFADERLGELLFRYRARNHPQSLNAEEQSRWRAHCRSKINFSDYFEKLGELQGSEAQASATAQALLAALRTWAEGLQQRLKE
jgi:exodeoxyribonuclease I